MKKIIASAVGLMLVGGVAVTNASAVESQFGGYWRTRAYFMNNFSQPPESSTYSVDTRTRLYYTAKFSDDFKFVNKFEFNTMWGDNNGGDLATDGKGNFRIKNSYVDFNLGMVNVNVGLTAATIARGFVFSDDFAGAIVTADFGMVKVPVLWAMASNENDMGWDGSAPETVAFTTNSTAGVVNFVGGDGNVNILSTMPKFTVGPVELTVPLTWATVSSQDTDMYWIGLDADAKFDAVSAWGTFIYNGGSIDGDYVGADADQDISAYLVAAGVDAGIVHGQGFYASGDDNEDDNDVDSFVTIGAGNGSYGTSYYWAEILGDGIFDYAVPDGTLGDHISNIWALNVGVTLKPMDKLTLGFDVWYAQLAEKLEAYNGQMEDDLGLELDGRVSYALMDNLTADLVLAYLAAGDAIGPEDVWEGGVRLSLSF